MFVARASSTAALTPMVAEATMMSGLKSMIGIDSCSLWNLNACGESGQLEISESSGRDTY